jgi:hypothetical protein
VGSRLSERLLNPKAQAWDAVGLKFWELGRRTAKPSPQTLRWFCKGLAAGEPCLIVGGTSVGLIRAVAQRECSVTVVDFSSRICAELPGRLPTGVEVACHDIFALPQSWAASFDHLLCDTLINRFDGEETRRFEAVASGVLRAGGTLRATVKLGLYAMDKRLLKLTAELGQPADFWDDETHTIDYGRLGPMLELGALRHGGISRSDLLRWYAGRGREKRFDLKDIEVLLDTQSWENRLIEPDPPAEDRVRVLATRAP